MRAPTETVAVVRQDGPAQAWIGWVTTALVVATPFLAYLGNLGFAPAVALAGLLTLPVAGWRRAPWPVLAVLALGVAWAAVSVGWSPFHPPPLHSFKEAEQITAVKLALQLVLYGALVVAAARVTPAAAGRALRIGAILLAALSVLLLIEAFDGARLYQAIRAGAHLASSRVDWAKRDLARATYVLALLFWPAALALSRRGLSGAAAVAFVVTLMAGVALHVDSPLVALALSAPVFSLVRYNGRVGVVLTAVGVLAYVALAPVAMALASPVLNGHAFMSGIGKASWAARLQIWTFVEGLIQQKPLVGWGLDASRAWPGVIPLHPHDGALQVWLELGTPGVLLEVLFWVLVFAGVLRLMRRDQGAAAAACAAICAYVVIGALSFGVWQEWWLALGALAAVWITLLDRNGLDEHANDLPALLPEA